MHSYLWILFLIVEVFVSLKFQSRERFPLDRRHLLQAAALVLLFTDPKEGWGQTSAGAVEEVKGDAFADTNGRHRSLDHSSPLFVRDLVGTGAQSRLTAKLGRDTTLRLGVGKE